MQKHELLTQLLNLKCNRTGKPIKAGEVVRIHNWGGEGEPIGYGHWEWDEQDRSFSFHDHELLNTVFNHNSNSHQDNYDLFRAFPEKLTAEEKKVLKG